MGELHRREEREKHVKTVWTKTRGKNHLFLLSKRKKIECPYDLPPSRARKAEIITEYEPFRIHVGRGMNWNPKSPEEGLGGWI